LKEANLKDLFCLILNLQGCKDTYIYEN